VHFTFMNSVLQIGAVFSVLVPGQTETSIDPIAKRGDLTVPWALVGKIVTSVVWDETIRIVFTDQQEIVIRPSRGQSRGTVIGRDMTIEDF